MAVTLGKNISSLKVGRQLSLSQQKLSSTFERLSSGLRINDAGDDPAGLSVSSKLELNTRVLNRAKLNLSDAISVLNTADSSLDSVSTLMIRMNELASQAASGTFSAEQRRALDKEFTALDQEIRRINASTEFNDIDLLSTGEFSMDETVVLHGDGGFNSTTLTTTSQNLRYTVAYTGIPIATQRPIHDAETGEVYSLSYASDPELGSLSALSVHGVTNDGKVIFSANTSVGSITNIYSYDVHTDSVTRLTNGETTDLVAGIGLSGDSNTLVFSSQTIYADNGSAQNSLGNAGAYRLYALDLSTGTVKTNGQDLTGALGTYTRVSGDGTKVAYLASGDGDIKYQDFTGDPPSSEVNVFTLIGGVPATHSILGVRNNGELLMASVDDLAGNGNTNRNVFQINTTSGAVSQITEFEINSDISSHQLSADGTILVFSSQGDYTGENGSGDRQAFRLDFTTNQLHQLTNFDGSYSIHSGAIRIATDGSRVTVREDNNDDILHIDILEAANEFDFEAGYGAAGRLFINFDSLRTAYSELGGHAISSAAGARLALEGITEAIGAVSNVRGKIGAGLSRIEVASRMSEAQVVEFKAANSRIRDADLAEETANLTKYSILQQASAALHAQTNLQPQIAVSLISGNRT